MVLRAYSNKLVDEMKKNVKPIVDKCKKQLEGDEVHICSRTDGEGCKVYQDPSLQWRLGDCPMADNELKSTVIEEPKQKVRVGQQKQKKRR